MWCASKHDAGFHFNPVPVPQVRPELPLTQGIADRFGLIGKCAEEVNVFHLALFTNYDPDRNRIKPLLAKHWVNSLDYVFVSCVILDARRDTVPARAPGGARLLRQFHLA